MSTHHPVDPDIAPEDALEAIEAAGDAAQDCIDAWREAKNAGALASVAKSGQGAVRKAARRALNILKSRGVEVPKLRRQPKASGAEGASLHAWLLAPDTAFNVLLVIARRSGTGRYSAAMVFLNDSFGVSRVTMGEYSQSGLKKAISSILPNAGFKPTEVPPEWARYRVKKALDTQRERGGVLPLGLTSAADLLNPAPDGAVAHPLDSEGLEVSLEDSRTMSQGSEVLHLLPEFKGWIPPKHAIDEMLLEVGKTLTPGETPDQANLQSTLRAQVTRATDRYFSPEERARLVSAMKDSTLSILAREGEAKALEIVAVMNCIENAGLITDPPSEVPFLKMFFDKAVAVMLSQGKGSLKIPIPNVPVATPAVADATVPEAPDPLVEASPPGSSTR